MLYYLVVVAFLALDQYPPVFISETPVDAATCEKAAADGNANDPRIQDEALKALGARYTCLGLKK